MPIMDIRNEKTEEIIKEEFLKLLKEKELNKISVAELSRNARIGRGTFYLHYDDVYDLYESFERETLETLAKSFENAFPTTNKSNLEKLVDELVTYIETNKDFFRIIAKDNLGITIYKLKKLFYSKVFEEDTKINPYGNKTYDKNESIFVVSGIIGVIERWIMDDFLLSKEEISSNISKIVRKVNDN